VRWPPSLRSWFSFFFFLGRGGGDSGGVFWVCRSFSRGFGFRCLLGFLCFVSGEHLGMLAGFCFGFFFFSFFSFLFFVFSKFYVLLFLM